MTPTVLVLGAGASHPYGYPLGKELLNKIVDRGMNRTDRSSNLFKCGIPQVHIEKFAEALKQSSRESVDAFLESRTNFLDVGRLAIADEVLGCEKPAKIFKTDDWYQYLFNKICDSKEFESFGASKVSIVTFNYDRSLEFCLFKALRQCFRKSLEECVENFERIKIIHVHGRLGPSPTEESTWPPYGGSPIRPHDLLRLSQQIKIMPETTDDSAEFEAARDVLRKAERICFLGFGFHTINLKRLFKGVTTVLDPTPPPPSKHWSLSSGVKIFGHNYDFTETERVDIQRFLPLPTCDWGDHNQSCKEFLRKKGVLLD